MVDISEIDPEYLKHVWRQEPAGDGTVVDWDEHVRSLQLNAERIGVPWEEAQRFFNEWTGEFDWDGLASLVETKEGG